MNTLQKFAKISDAYADPSTSKTTLIPVSFKETEFTDQIPTVFLEASTKIELFDIETNSEVYKNGIYVTDTLNESNSSEKLIETIHETVKKYIKRNKLVTLVGANRLISTGAIRAFNECFKDISVLQIDARANLKKQESGVALKSSSALVEANQNTNLIQVGIRSMDKAENSIVNSSNIFYAHEMISDDFWVDNVVDLIKEDVYITFDLSALDPSIAPSVNHPIPGGLLWYETLDFLKTIFAEKNVVGFDIVGFTSTHCDATTASVAAQLYYKMLTYKFENNEPKTDNE